MTAFQGFFLSFLGADFLQVLYASILGDPSGIAYIYEDGGKISGFVSGSDQPKGLYRRLIRRRWWRFCLASILPILKKPAIIPRLFRALSFPDVANPGAGCGTLMSIAVLPEAQGQGAGRMLTEAFLEEATRRGLAQVNLMTDKWNNEATNQFYQNYGFSLTRSYVTPEGREMNEYRIHLAGSRT